MGMICNLARIPEAIHLRLLDEPELVFQLLYPAHPATEAPLGDFWKNIIQFFSSTQPGTSATEPAEPMPVFEQVHSSDSLNIDKAWHGLHFLFTGRADAAEMPAGFLQSGGEFIGDVDVGYGPARCFFGEELQSISTFLDSQAEATLKSRIDLLQMEQLGIYPPIWSNYDNGEDWDYLRHYFQEMQKFIQQTARTGQSLLIYYN